MIEAKQHYGQRMQILICDTPHCGVRVWEVSSKALEQKAADLGWAGHTCPHCATGHTPLDMAQRAVDESGARMVVDHDTRAGDPIEVEGRVVAVAANDARKGESVAIQLTEHALGDAVVHEIRIPGADRQPSEKRNEYDAWPMANLFAFGKF